MHLTYWYELVWFSVRSIIVVMLSTLFPQTPLWQWTMSVMSWRRWSQKWSGRCGRMLVIIQWRGKRWGSCADLGRRMNVLTCMSTVTHILHGKISPGHYTIITRWLQLRKWGHISLLEVSHIWCIIQLSVFSLCFSGLFMVLTLYSIKLSTYGFLPRVLLLRNIAWTSNLDQKVGGRQGYKYLKSQGAAYQNTSAMAILAYNCECQLSTVGTYYRHTVYFQYNQLSSLGALSSQCMQSKSKKII